MDKEHPSKPNPPSRPSPPSPSRPPERGQEHLEKGVGRPPTKPRE